jgi:hypothetical protein
MRHRPLEDDSDPLLELLGLPHLLLLICASLSNMIGEALPQISTSSSIGSPTACKPKTKILTTVQKAYNLNPARISM